MKGRDLTLIVVALTVGFIGGYFVSLAVNQSQAPAGPVTASSSQEELPEGHPAPEQIAALEQLVARARSDPQDIQARIQLGNFYYDIDKHDIAIPWYEQALELDPENVNLRTDLGTCYLANNRPQDAIEMYERSLDIEPTHPQTLQNIGFAYQSIGRGADAVVKWRELLNYHPDHPNAERILQQIEEVESRVGQVDTRP